MVCEGNVDITVIGAGYVGLVTAACLAKFGHTVICVEQDRTRVASISAGNCPIFEPGLPELLRSMIRKGALRITSDMTGAVRSARAIFIAVGTPSKPDGSANISQILDCASRVAADSCPGAVIVVKSTVPVGTSRTVLRMVTAGRAANQLSVALNPEFLREGSAVKDFERPDRIVVGLQDKNARNVMRQIYAPLTRQGYPLLETSYENAELIKYASNAFLALKVTFANELADLCEAVRGNFEDVTKGVGLDNRIGPKFLKAGPGFGGSCFPKDTRAFASTGERYGARQTLVERVIAANEDRKIKVAQRILALLGPTPKDKCVCIWGIAFKANTDDIREAPALAIIQHIEAAGVRVRAHDPQAMGAAEKVLSATEFFDKPEEAAEGVDLVAVLTEWTVYKSIDFNSLAKVVKRRVIADFRNIVPKQVVTNAGFELVLVGNGVHHASPLAHVEEKSVVGGLLVLQSAST